MQQLLDYDTFLDKGHDSSGLEDYQKIRCHIIFAVKHDGRHKARFVAGGHLTEPTNEQVYSGVVSLKAFRLVLFLAELNELELYAADVGNAYLEAYTKEKVYFIAGKEFADFGMQGHILIIKKALYGLSTSGSRWAERFHEVLKSEGFAPSLADENIWMRKNDEFQIWEYVCVYVDDLAVAMKNPKPFLDKLAAAKEEGGHNFKLKGVGPLTFHLGCDFARDPDGTLKYMPKKYIAKMKETYQRLFPGEKIKEYASALDKGDHPELDASPLLNEEGIAKYQSMIGALQWLITLGRFDVATATMTMSKFRPAPREGHLNRVKRIYGYVQRFKDAAVRIRTGEPDYQGMSMPEHDWMYSVYGNVKEEEPAFMPEPLGKRVVTTTFVDANLYHDYLDGRPVTGILHFVNQTPVDWYTKKQATVATATFGSEFVAARTATDQIMDLHFQLRMLGVPLKFESHMFGDNKSIITQSTLPHSKLTKRHNALAYHRVREAIASGFLKFIHLPGAQNPADVLTKHCGYQEAWPLLKPILFWMGDTAQIQSKGSDKRDTNSVSLSITPEPVALNDVAVAVEASELMTYVAEEPELLSAVGESFSAVG